MHLFAVIVLFQFHSGFYAADVSVRHVIVMRPEPFCRKVLQLTDCLKDICSKSYISDLSVLSLDRRFARLDAAQRALTSFGPSHQLRSDILGIIPASW